LTDAEGTSKKEVIKTTPLIEHLREKKAAAKEKPSSVKAAAAAAAAAKHGRQESKDGKSAEKQDKKAVKPVIASPEKGKKLTKAEKAAREAVKVLNREAAAVAAPTAPAAERKRERVAPAISVAAKIQRDLGLAPAGGRRGKREATSEAQLSAAESSHEGGSATSASTTLPSATVAPKKESRTPRGRRSSKSSIVEKTNQDPSAEPSKKVPTGPAHPTILKKPIQAQNLKAPATTRPTPPQGPKTQTTALNSAASLQVATSTPTPSAPTSASLNRQAFLKHANPSQGITEVLIEEALSAFGKVEKVEIDRKKGFAYVTFGDNETLRKACSAGSVKVAQGAVQVLERRDRPSGRPLPLAPIQMQRGGFRGRGGRGRGGRGGAGIGGAPVSPIVQGAPLATASTPSTSAVAVSAPNPNPTPAKDG
jgi:regulator of nonsense transcripts 3